MSSATKIPARAPRRQAKTAGAAEIPQGGKKIEVEVDGKALTLTNLAKPFWPELGITKGRLLQYYADVAPLLLPHLKDRPMVMKRYPGGAAGKFFFMKHAPEPRPDWVETCKVDHASGNVVDFPMVQDLASLLWVVNLGCIDMNQWYARCDDVMRPDYLHFDLDPAAGATFTDVRNTALQVHDGLTRLKMPCYAKTSGASGIHIYVPIKRGPLQRKVWEFAKAFAQLMEKERPELITSEYIVSKRPHGHVLVDYNQNSWGHTLASVYSVRPEPKATVSMPVEWDEVKAGFEIEDFRLDNAMARLKKTGDKWKPVLHTSKPRIDLEKLL